MTVVFEIKSNKKQKLNLQQTGVCSQKVIQEYRIVDHPGSRLVHNVEDLQTRSKEKQPATRQTPLHMTNLKKKCVELRGEKNKVNQSGKGSGCGSRSLCKKEGYYHKGQGRKQNGGKCQECRGEQHLYLQAGFQEKNEVT